MTEVPFLLAVDGLSERILKKFNTLKREQDPAFLPLEHKWEINSRPGLRTDTLWSTLVPKGEACKDVWKTRYVLVPTEMAPYVTVDEYDGSESCHIDYNAYGVAKIKEILANPDEGEKLIAIQRVIDKVVAESSTGTGS